jgi:hypothetical protein
MEERYCKNSINFYENTRHHILQKSNIPLVSQFYASLYAYYLSSNFGSPTNLKRLNLKMQEFEMIVHFTRFI